MNVPAPPSTTPATRCAELTQRLGRPVRVGLLEDEPHTRAALAHKLRVVPGLDLVACEATLAEMRARLSAQTLDVLIADLGLPDGSGLDLIAQVHRDTPQTHIVVLTVLDDERKLVAAIERGARGYLLKDEPALGLIDAIVEVMEGGAPISPAIARYLVQRLTPTTPVDPAARCWNSRPRASPTPRSRN